MTTLNTDMLVSDIVLDHAECAGIFQKHQIDYCCHGNVSLAQACAERGLDLEQVSKALAEVMADRTPSSEADPRKLSTPALIDHIVHRYHGRLREVLPTVVPLAEKVARVHGAHNPRLPALREAVAALGATLLEHIDQEEEALFPALRKGEQPSQVLSTALEEHLETAKLLEKVRAEAEDFTIPDWACASYKMLFRELPEMESELFEHVHLENHVLFPRFTPAA